MRQGFIAHPGGALQKIRTCLYLPLALAELSCLTATELQLLAKCLLRPGSLISRWIAGVLVSTILFCSALASNSSLHRLIHRDAGNEHHECAITIFAHGNVNMTDGNPAVVVPVFTELPARDSFQDIALISGDYLLLPGRAPPVLST